jgi:hypothetical protein
MCKFFKVAVTDKSGKKLEDLRVNCAEVKSYRRWLNKSGRDQTILFYRNGDELIVDTSVEELDQQHETHVHI